MHFLNYFIVEWKNREHKKTRAFSLLGHLEVSQLLYVLIHSQKEKSKWVGRRWRDSQSGWAVWSLSVWLWLLCELMLYRHSWPCYTLISFRLSSTAALPSFLIEFLFVRVLSSAYAHWHVIQHCTYLCASWFSSSMVRQQWTDRRCHIRLEIHLPESLATTPFLLVYLSRSPAPHLLITSSASQSWPFCWYHLLYMTFDLLLVFHPIKCASIFWCLRHFRGIMFSGCACVNPRFPPAHHLKNKGLNIFTLYT